MPSPTEGFFHDAPTIMEMVDTQVLDDTIKVNNEEASKCSTNTFSSILQLRLFA